MFGQFNIIVKYSETVVIKCIDKQQNLGNIILFLLLKQQYSKEDSKKFTIYKFYLQTVNYTIQLS
ncbi:hypothetical protein CHBNV3_05840 [Haemophilus influenzae]|uniref:Uncharacterized protein n=1 Tax=Haemophilus influenzae TaxID=727 RepID=A0A158SZ85_HAEIF|nr:hypothetical protein DLK00_06370 [Haemophilus influenzae]QEQ58375.1 hypothetical protein F1541_03815 [Haemophilus influenzae biotype aegyptius]AXP35918.1 hypothetical protein CH613_02760 [Haemophilus influenzae]AXP55849.1 hypothetical protein CH631_02790 [Haemophilus influenzae]AXP60892.1 hypothetical protein CH624_02800 [Haemophilus influenzae]